MARRPLKKHQSKRLDQASFAGDFSREVAGTYAEFSADVVEVIINIGLAAVHDHGNLPRRLASLAPLQELLFPLRELDRLKLIALPWLGCSGWR